MPWKAFALFEVCLAVAQVVVVVEQASLRPTAKVSVSTAKLQKESGACLVLCRFRIDQVQPDSHALFLGTSPAEQWPAFGRPYLGQGGTASALA